LKSENLIKQKSLEKNALTQKMNSEFDEMAKIKQIEIDKIVIKYKNKKFDLETRQGKEKNIHENENLMKANIFNSNLINFSNTENTHNSMNKSLNRPSTNLILDSKLKEINPLSKGTLYLSNEKKASDAYISNSNVSDEKKNNGYAVMNKSLKLFNKGKIGSIKQKSDFVRNLQYSSAQN